LGLTAAQYGFVGDRHFGVGADQILGVRAAPTPDVDFEYVIHNGGDGGQVENCGNGARCFVRYVRERGLTGKRHVRVRIKNGVIELAENADGQVTVNMGAPLFDLPAQAFSPGARQPRAHGAWQLWPLDFGGAPATAWVAVLAMGNPLAVMRVDDAERAPVAELGPLIERHPAFPQRINACFLQIIDRAHLRLRVYERGAGETLACGSGACAAVVTGIRLGLLDARVQVQARGGQLLIEWAGGASDAVRMTGPAVTVFEGVIDVPDLA
jgi:diaminopimelate epimerase